jgi:iron complex transport system permease protein
MGAPLKADPGAVPSVPAGSDEGRLVRAGGNGGVSRLRIALLILLPSALLFVSLFVGRYPMSPLTCAKVLLAPVIPIEHTWDPTLDSVIWDIRVWRALLAMMIGAGLSISGASFQGMFQNPLVSPDILGVSAAAGFGACVAILLSGSEGTIQASAFLFGLIGVAATYLLGRVYRTAPVLMLVLSGIICGSVFSAFISITKIVADPLSRLPAITFWLMGSLSSVSSSDVLTTGPPIIAGSAGLVLLSWRINLLSMGDEEARSLGARTELLKAAIIVCCTIITASAVCVAGIVGWVGLVIPHIGRMVVGPNHRALLPASMAIGAAYLLLIDNLARTAAPIEIPLGILTAIIGAPFFGYLLRKTKGAWK